MGNSQTRMNNNTTAEQAAVDMDLKDKICIVTGCNTGIGKETARVLAKHNATVIMACRSIERGNEAKKEIVANLKQSNAEFNENLFKVMELDLSSLQSIKQFAANYAKEYNNLHYLINNAGVMAVQEWTPTKDNYEMQFGTNHIGHFYLTLLLTPILIASKPSRVINVASDAHKQSPNPLLALINECIKKSDGPPKEPYSPLGNYGISKACNILFAREYDRRYHSQGVTSVSLHPGVIPTDLTRHVPNWMAGILRSSIARPFVKTIAQGSATTIRCCSLKDNEIQGGHYYKDCNEANALLHQQFRFNGNYSELSDDKVANDQAYLLWQLSEKLITQKNFTFNLNDANVEQKSNTENNTNEEQKSNAENNTSSNSNNTNADANTTTTNTAISASPTTNNDNNVTSNTASSATISTLQTVNDNNNTTNDTTNNTTNDTTTNITNDTTTNTTNDTTANTANDTTNTNAVVEEELPKQEN